MRRILLSTTALLALGAGTAFADTFNDAIIADLQSKNFDRIEIKTGPTQVKVEAVRLSTNTKLEVVYDRATGEILDQEFEAIEEDDDTTPGIEIEQEDEDFFDDDDDDDDDDDEYDDDEDSEDYEDSDDGEVSDDDDDDEDGDDDDEDGNDT